MNLFFVKYRYLLRRSNYTLCEHACTTHSTVFFKWFTTYFYTCTGCLHLSVVQDWYNLTFAHFIHSKLNLTQLTSLTFKTDSVELLTCNSQRDQIWMSKQSWNLNTFARIMNDQIFNFTGRFKAQICAHISSNLNETSSQTCIFLDDFPVMPLSHTHSSDLKIYDVNFNDDVL